jgi:UDPglucose--hexose-1-phosphate uridylyltransferase
MPEMRRNPLTDTWVVISPEREARPTEFQTNTLHHASSCPFCPGHENATPKPILTFQGDATPWSLRVIPNLYPALRVEEQHERAAHGAWDWMAGVGAHEVVIESADHAQPRGKARAEMMSRTLEAVAMRLSDLSRDKRLQHITWFKNQGALAGATLDHPHSLILALPVVPRSVRDELDRGREHEKRTGRSLVDDLVQSELSDGVRLLGHQGRAVAFCPYASKSPFEFWVVHRDAASHVERDNREHRESVAQCLSECLDRLESALPEVPWNLTLHSAPVATASRTDYRWHIRVLPRTQRAGGLEWGSDVHINPTPPERAAAFLQSVSLHAI